MIIVVTNSLHDAVQPKLEWKQIPDMNDWLIDRYSIGKKYMNIHINSTYRQIKKSFLSKYSCTPWWPPGSLSKLAAVKAENDGFQDLSSSTFY